MQVTGRAWTHTMAVDGKRWKERARERDETSVTRLMIQGEIAVGAWWVSCRVEEWPSSQTANAPISTSADLLFA